MPSKIKGVPVTSAQQAVYYVLKHYGPLPDHALVPLAQHVTLIHQSSSGIRSRRAELVRKGLVSSELLTTRTSSGRSANIWSVV